MNNEELNKQLNEKNINLVTSVFNQVFGGKAEVTYKKNKDGNFIIYKDGKPLYQISEKNKVGDVLKAIASKLGSQKNPSNPKKFPGNPPRIFTSLSKLNGTIDDYKKILSKIEESSSYTKSDFITGELKREYNGLDDSTVSNLSLLYNYVGNLSSVINTLVMTYMQNDAKLTDEFRALVSELFGGIDKVDARMREQENALRMAEGNGDKISIEEFYDLFGEADTMFEGMYADILKDFKAKLSLQYLMFKAEQEPQILDGVVESMYLSGTKFEINSKEYIEGLKSFKDSFKNHVFDLYPHDDETIKNSEMPFSLWEDKDRTDYEKALLLSCYNNFKGLSLFKFCENYQDENFVYNPHAVDSCVFRLNRVSEMESWFRQGLELDDTTSLNNLKQFASNYQQNMETLLGNMAACDSMLADKLEIDESNQDEFVQSMIKNGYLTSEKEMKSVSLSILDVYKKDGVNGVHKVLSSFKDEEEINDILETSFFNGVNELNSYYSFIEKYQNPVNDFIEKKLKLDSAKANFKSGLAASIDTSSVTEEQIAKAKEFLGEDANYLEDWQIKTYALLNLKTLTSNGSFDEKEVKKTNNIVDALDSIYNNQIASKKGYEAAVSQIDKMVGGTEHSVLSTIFGEGYSVVGGFYDGVLNSIKGVCRVVTADGKMNVDDYRQSYLLEMLNSDYSLFSDYYDSSRSNHNKVLSMLGKSYDINSLSGYKDDKGNSIILTEEELEKAREKDLTLYELLYLKKGISDKEYLAYSNLNQRKDDGNIKLYADMGVNPGYKDVAGITYNVANGVGNMAITMALSTVNPVLGQIWMGLSVTGNEREEMLLSGKENNAMTFVQAACKGILAVGTEKALGALKGIGDKADDVLGIFKLDKPGMQKFVTSKFGQMFARTISNQVNETIEEITENAGNYVLDFIFDGKIPKGEEILAETWQTAYMTFLTTPLINMMGSGMQTLSGNNVNQKTLHSFNGLNATYSDAEMAFYMDDNGNLNRKQFFEFLAKNNRLSGDTKSFGPMPTFNNSDVSIDSSRFILERSNSANLEINDETLRNARIDDIMAKINKDGIKLNDEQTEILNERLIKSQDFFANNYSTISGNNPEDRNLIVKYVLENPNVLSHYSTENLIRLSAFSNSFDLEAMTNEMQKRFNNGENIFEIIPRVSYAYGEKYVDVLSFIKKISSIDIELVKNMAKKACESAKKYLPTNFYNMFLTDGAVTNVSCISSALSLASMIKNGEIDNRGFNFLNSMTDNKTFFTSFNYNMLNSSIMDDFGFDFATKMGRFSELSDELISLKENNPKVYEALKQMINSSSDESLQSFTSKTKSDIDFMFKNASVLEENIDNINLEALQEYIGFIDKFEVNDIPKFSNDFSERLFKSSYEKLQHNLKKYLDGFKIEGYTPPSADFSRIKDDYYKTFFQSTKSSIDDFIKKYSHNYSEIREKLMKNESLKPYLSLVDTLMKIDSTTDPQEFAEIVKATDSSMRFTANDLSMADEILRREYVNSYLDAFDKTNTEIKNRMTSEVHDGKSVDVVDLSDNFSFIVHSSDSGFVAEKKLIDDSFSKTFRQTRDISTHGISSSFISPNSMGFAPVGDNGVLYGFTKMNSDAIQGMGSTDIDSNVTDYGFSSGVKQEYMLPGDVSNQTYRLYNEFLLDRDMVDPSCVIITSDMSETVQKNSYRAASELGVPVVRINVLEVAERQTTDIKNKLASYDKTHDVNAIVSAVRNYESGTSGFNLNTLNTEGKHSNVHSSVAGYYEELGIGDSIMKVAEDLIARRDTDGIKQLYDELSNIRDLYEVENNVFSPQIDNTKSAIDYDGILDLLSMHAGTL